MPSVPAHWNRAGMSGVLQPTLALQGCSAAQAAGGKPQNTPWLILVLIASSWNTSLKVSKTQLLHPLKESEQNLATDWKTPVRKTSRVSHAMSLL